MADFGPSKFEQDIDGGVQNANTALWGDPNAQGRMAYLRARAGLEQQQQADDAQKQASFGAVGDFLHSLNGRQILPGEYDNMFANLARGGDISGAGQLLLSRNANTGQNDGVVARSYVGDGKAITPGDAFSLPGQGAIIQGQNNQANAIQQATAASAFAQAVMGQQHEDSRNAATIAGEASRDNNSPIQIAEAAYAAGKATPDQIKLLQMKNPTAANADQPIKVTPADGYALTQEVDSQLKSSGAAFLSVNEAAVTARAIQLYQDKTSPVYGNPSAAVQQAIADTTQPGPPDKGWGIGAPTPTLVMKGAAQPAATPPAIPQRGAAAAQPPSASAPPGTPVQINDAAGYNALPKGAAYIDPTGVSRIKQ